MLVSIHQMLTGVVGATAKMAGLALVAFPEPVGEPAELGGQVSVAGDDDPVEGLDDGVDFGAVAREPVTDAVDVRRAGRLA